jgi:hypothetical protein
LKINESLIVLRERRNFVLANEDLMGLSEGMNLVANPHKLRTHQLRELFRKPKKYDKGNQIVT